MRLIAQPMLSSDQTILPRQRVTVPISREEKAVIQKARVNGATRLRKLFIQHDDVESIDQSRNKCDSHAKNADLSARRVKHNNAQCT